MTKPITNSFTLNPISSDTLTILKAYKKPMWAISILMWILIFVLNVFFAWAFFGNTFNDQMKDKLGIYIYLNDVASSENDAISIKTSLEEKWIKVSYTSKDDALSFVEKRVPDLTDTFKKYNMDKAKRYHNQMLGKNSEYNTSKKSRWLMARRIVKHWTDVFSEASKWTK